MADVNKIKHWQQNFYQGVFEPTLAHVEQACSDIQITGTLSSEQRLDIYRNSILGGITSALMGIYPVCRRLVGDVFFTNMVSGYLKKYPSTSPDVGFYGEYLGDYLQLFLIKINQQETLKYLPDVARLEWLWHQAFNASDLLSDNNLLPLSELANIDSQQQGDIHFKLLPSLGLLNSNFPIDEIWQANQKSESENDNHALSIDCCEEYREFYIWRDSDFSMRIEPITIQSGLSFLSDIKNGLCFADIAAKDYASSVPVLLPYFLKSGVIIGFKLESKN